MSKRVAVIGAGASGIVCAKKFLDAGFIVTVFEKNESTAGVWNYSDNGVVYKSLRTNLPKEIMVFEDQVVPYACEESFPDYTKVRDYLANNCKAWGVERFIKFNCKVVSLTPIDTKNNLTGWNLTYKQKEVTKTECFDFIAVCNGHYEVPNFPEDIKVTDDVKECFSHSKDYRNPNNFGNRVLCIGYSSSSNDIVRDLLGSDREVFVSQKSTHKTAEQLSLANSDGLKFVSQIESVKKEAGEYIAKTQYGSRLVFDDLIFCTGYKYSFPFLNEEIISTKNNIVKPLYSELIHEKFYSLAFVGLCWKTLPFVLAESQAIFLSKAWLDESVVELVNRLETSQDHYTRVKQANLPDKYYHCLADQQWIYNKKLISLVDELTTYRSKRIEAIEEIFNIVAITKAEELYNYREKSYCFDRLQALLS